MKRPKEATTVNCKLTHYIMQSSSAVSFSTVHVFFLCGSVLKFQRKTHSSQIRRNFFWSFHAEKLIQPFQQLRKPCFWKFLYVGSTYIDFIKVVNHCFSFWSELECCPNCRARRCLSWTFFLFLSLLFCCLTSVSKNLFWHNVSAGPPSLSMACKRWSRNTVVRNLFLVCQFASCDFSYVLNMYMPV